MVAQSYNGFEMIDEIVRDPFFNNKIIHVEKIPGKEGSSVSLDRLSGDIDESLMDTMRQRGISALYKHQYEAISSVLAGNDVVVATPTASGKTLVYNTIVLNSYLRDPSSRALYIFPLKALAQDQLKNLSTLSDLLGLSTRSVAGIYDGDTTGYQRKSIRQDPPGIIISNPDMLHLSFLPNHLAWESYLKNLKYIIVDEVHTYRGIFGSNVANVFRRLNRILQNLGVNPIYICTSATMAHTGEFMYKLLGREFNIYSENQAPSPKKNFIFLNPSNDSDTPGRSASAGTTATRLLAKFVQAGIRTICFTQSRKQAELVAKWARESLPTELRGKVESYRAGYLPDDRRKIEARMASGNLLGIVSTSALELGIDIGYLDSCILFGYPGTLISTWQRAGRVGRTRKKEDAYISFVAGRDALDQYLVNHSNDFFTRRWEKAVIDPDNPNILNPHILCAAKETPITEKEIGSNSLFPLTSIFKLKGEHQLRRIATDNILTTDIGRPHRRVDIRNMGFNFRIMREDGTQLGDIDNGRVFHECHPQAIYLHQGENYMVKELDLLSHRVMVARTDSPNHTSPMVEKNISAVRWLQGKRYGPVELFFGDIKIEEQVVGFYEKTPGPKSRVIRNEEFEKPMPKQVINTKGVWFTLPFELAESIQEKFATDPWETVLTPAPLMITEAFAGSIHGAEHNLISILPVYAMCDRWDVGGLSTAMSPDTSRPSIFVYDAIEGGVGFAERAYEMSKEWSASSLKSLQGCKCIQENGCPSCIQSPKCGNNNTPLHRKGAELVMKFISQQLLENDGEAIMITPTGGTSAKMVEGGEKPEEPIEIKKEISSGSTDKIDELLDKGILIFDLETENLAHEVGGWNNIRDMGVSVAVTYDTAAKDYSIHSGEGIKKMIQLLYEAPLVVGFNLHNFDWEVMEGFKDFDRTRIKALDLFRVIQKNTRRKISLNNLGKQNVGMEKTGDGFKAVKWHRSGEFDKLSNYCKRDVEITYNLFLHILRYGKIEFEVPEFEHVIEVDVDLWDEIEHIL